MDHLQPDNVDGLTQDCVAGVIASPGKVSVGNDRSMENAEAGAEKLRAISKAGRKRFILLS